MTKAKLPEMATRVAASADAFARRGRKPWSSVNFITAHDGFTLHDLVSYNEKHNEANGENNQDGHSDNLSWNHGVEGPTDDPDIAALRTRQTRNLLATLLLAQGTPMLLAGDEFGRTQQGNNNAYAQDNAISWVDWNISDDGAALIEFVRRVIALRQAFPILRRSRFLTGEYNADLDVKDVRWLTPAATDIEGEQWQDANARCFGMLMDGRAQATGIKRPSMDATVLLVLNAYHDVVKFTLPEVRRRQTLALPAGHQCAGSQRGRASPAATSIESHRTVAAVVRAAAGQRALHRADARARGDAAGDGTSDPRGSRGSSLPNDPPFVRSAKAARSASRRTGS